MERFRLDNDPENPRKGQYWPDDMTNALSVMAPLPTGLTGRGGMMGLYVAEWQEDLIEAFGSNFGDLNGQPPEFNFYLKPPAAGNYTEFIFTLAGNVDAVIQSVGAYVGVGDALIRLARRRRDRDDPDHERNGIYDPPIYLYTTVRGIEAMCLHHAVHHYYDPVEHPSIDLKTTTRNEHVGSAQHPSPGLRCSVVVSMGQDQYVYIVDANARAVEHFLLSSEGIRGLPLPDWFGDREDWDPYQTEDIDPIIPEGLPADPGPRFNTLGSIPNS